LDFLFKFTFYKKFFVFLDTMTNYLLPDYEKQCLTEYLSAGEDRLIFANTGDQQLNVLTSLIVSIFSINIMILLFAIFLFRKIHHLIIVLLISKCF